MTIQTLFDKVNKEKPNSFSEEHLLSFLNEIEAKVAYELTEDFTPYEEVDDTVLLAPSPYDMLYVSYLKAQIDYANEEIESYANNQAQHDLEYDKFTDWIIREHVNVESIVPSRFRNIF
jgi:hypothetical protein